MLSDYQALLTSLVRDDNAVITPTDIDRAIQLAVVRYSTDFPLNTLVDLTPNGTQKLPLPVDWRVGFSRLVNIEYPLNAFPPYLLSAEEFCLYQQVVAGTTPLAFEFTVLFDFVPDETVRVTYTVPHSLTTLVDTVNPMHCEAVTCWAAALCCDQLASYYASASDSTIQADHVQRNSQSADYARLAKNYRARYFSDLAVNEQKTVSASAVVDLDLQDSRGRDRFTHSNRFR
jgi:hypothetical protein